MNCEEAVDLIVDSLMDSLDEGQRETLVGHLRGCASCAREAEAIGRTWEALGRLTAPDARVPEATGFAPGSPARRRAHDRGRAAGPWLRAAAVVALLLLGGVAGFWVRGGGPDAGPTLVPGPEETSAFLFLVRGDTPEASLPEDSLVREYRAWASSLASEGRLVAGEKLEDEPGRWVSETDEEARTRSDISGFFVIAASDYGQAVEIALRSPHVRYGGTFEIRRIDRLN